MQAIVIVILLMAIFLVIFSLQNSTEITVHLLWWKIPEVPLALVVLSCLLLGFFVALLYFAPRLWKYKRQNKKLSKYNNELKMLVGQDQNPDENNPEGIVLEDDDTSFSFFKE